jgi:UDP-N-acetylmuramate dehydrogenase
MTFVPHAKIAHARQNTFVEAAQAAGFTVDRQVVLAPLTTFKIGGPADLLVTVERIDDLIRLVELARGHSMPFLLLGGGSNVLIADAGIRGLVILNRCRRVTHALPGEPGSAGVVSAESGAPLAGLARVAIHQGLAGLEWAVSVPGTVGGAVVGNAGAHGGCIADNLWEARILDSQGAVTTWPNAALQYAYRSSRLKSAADPQAAGAVVLSATFQLVHGERADIEAHAARFLAHRRATQPTAASVGSIFRNPPGDYAGRLIEAAGLKGMQIGQAQFSPVHANFLVNLGGATAHDVLTAIRLAQDTVAAQFGATLLPEILFVGDFEA